MDPNLQQIKSFFKIQDNKFYLDRELFRNIDESNNPLWDYFEYDLDFVDTSIYLSDQGLIYFKQLLDQILLDDNINIIDISYLRFASFEDGNISVDETELYNICSRILKINHILELYIDTRECSSNYFLKLINLLKDNQSLYALSLCYGDDIQNTIINTDRIYNPNDVSNDRALFILSKFVEMFDYNTTLRKFPLKYNPWLQMAPQYQRIIDYLEEIESLVERNKENYILMRQHFLDVLFQNLD